MRINRVIGIAVFTAAALGACRDRPDAAGGPYADIVARAVPQIEGTVGLRFRTPPRIETRSKAQVRAFVLDQLARPDVKRNLAGQQRAYRLLGMIPDTLDLTRLQTNLLEEQIVGFYDPRTKVLYVVQGAQKSIVQTVVTHELVHALQDQYVNLDSVQKATGDNDRQTAAQAVFEGQAVYEQLEAVLGPGNVAVGLPGGWERVREMIRNNRDAMPVYASAPLVVQETLLFPYLSGAEFIKNYKERERGGVPYAQMPVSTEQILHPAAYFGKRDAPTPVSFVTGASVKPDYDNDLGEFETRLFLYQRLSDQEAAVRGATGWDGDRYVVFATPHGDGVAWASVWDTQSDGADFYGLLQRVRDSGHGSARAIRVTTGEVEGRVVVLWVDVPAGENADAITLASVRVGASK